MQSKKIIKLVLAKLLEGAHPEKVILFGSCARGDMSHGSDIDLLIIEKNVSHKGKEMVRLRNLIGNVGVGIDILVCSEEEVDDWGHLPGTALYQALKEGKTIYEATH